MGASSMAAPPPTGSTPRSTPAAKPARLTTKQPVLTVPIRRGLNVRTAQTEPASAPSSRNLVRYRTSSTAECRVAYTREAVYCEAQLFHIKYRGILMRRTLALVVLTAAVLTAGTGLAAAESPSTGSASGSAGTVATVLCAVVKISACSISVPENNLPVSTPENTVR
ncbi:hypothetical protein ACWEOI_19345 [Nocardia sp. NPDC004340]